MCRPVRLLEDRERAFQVRPRLGGFSAAKLQHANGKQDVAGPWIVAVKRVLANAQRLLIRRERRVAIPLGLMQLAEQVVAKPLLNRKCAFVCRDPFVMTFELTVAARPGCSGV